MSYKELCNEELNRIISHIEKEAKEAEEQRNMSVTTHRMFYYQGRKSAFTSLIDYLNKIKTDN